MNKRAWNTVYYLVIPGTILHEISHALIVFLLPNIKITELNLTSYVEYEGTSNTIPRTFLIGYAPLFINTTVSFFCIYQLMNVNYMTGYRELIYAILLFYISLVSAFTALPSFQDAISPLRLMKMKLFTIKFPLIILVSPVVIFLSLPGLIISYLNKKSRLVQFLLCLTYATIVILVASGFITQDMIIHSYEYIEPYIRNIL